MEAIERYSGIFQGDEIRGEAAVHRFPAGRGDSSERRPAVQRRAIAARPRADARVGRSGGGPGAVRSIGRDRMVAGLVVARRTLQISSDQPVVFFLQRPRRLRTRIPTAARPATRSRRRSSRDSSSWSKRDAYAIWWYNRLQRPEVDLGQFDDSYVRDLQKQLGRNRPPALGARRHQRSRDSDLRGDHALDARTGRKISSSAPARISMRESPCCGR